jgi:hypothetical protein
VYRLTREDFLHQTSPEQYSKESKDGAEVDQLMKAREVDTSGNFKWAGQHKERKSC